MLTVILIGGESRRMGRDKAMLPVGNDKTMAMTLAERYAALGPVCFSVNEHGRFFTDGYEQLIDRYPGQGPLNGIISAFTDREEDLIFLTATDMPDGDADAVRYLLENIGSHDACMYEDEPLFALYRRSCLAPALQCIEEGRRSLHAMLRQVDALYLPKGDQTLFTNLNTPEEYRLFIDRRKQ